MMNRRAIVRAYYYPKMCRKIRFLKKTSIPLVPMRGFAAFRGSSREARGDSLTSRFRGKVASSNHVRACKKSCRQFTEPLAVPTKSYGKIREPLPMFTGTMVKFAEPLAKSTNPQWDSSCHNRTNRNTCSGGVPTYMRRQRYTAVFEEQGSRLITASTLHYFYPKLCNKM